MPPHYKDNGNDRRLARGGADGGVDGREPVVAVRLGAFGDAEEFRLQREGDRPGDTLANLDVVDGTDGSDFDSGADEEDFVSDVEHFAGNDLFLYGDVQVFSDLHDGVAGDARKNAGGQRRSVERAIVNEKNVHAGAFTDMAAGIESDAFGVAVEASFHANELRVHVIRGGLGHGGKSIRGNARPGTHADIDTLGERVRTEIGAPAPASHVNVDGRIQRIHSRFAVAAEHNGLDVTGIQFVQAHQLASGVGELIEGEGKFHAVDFCGVDETLHVFAQAEDRRALLGFIAADAFKDRGAVTHDVRQDVKFGVVPVDPLTVVPDFLGRLNRHRRSLFDSATRCGASRNCRIRHAAVSVNARCAPEADHAEPNWRVA